MTKMIPDADTLTGNEFVIVVQNGKLVRVKLQKVADKAPTIQGPKGDPGPKGDIGLTGPKGDLGLQGTQGVQGNQGAQGLAGKDGINGAKGDAGSPKRIERFSGVTNVSGIATITFSPAFDTIPDVDLIEDWSGEQMISGKVIPGTLTKTGCQAQVMVSRGTLLLSAGPFTKAAAGISITVRAIGN